MLIIPCILIVFYGLINISLAQLELPDHLKEPAQLLHNACRNKTNVPEEIIQQSVKGNLPDVPELKCYILCMLETVGLIDQAGNIDFQHIYYLLTSEVKERLEAVTSVCSTKHGADLCETAYLTVKCYFEADPENSMLP